VSCVSSLLINAGAGVRSNCARGSAVAANGLLSPPRGSTDPRLGAQSWPEISSKIVDLRRVICASPSYLARHGWPAGHAALLRHACLILSRNPGSATWSFRVNCKLARIDVKGPVSADSAGMLLQLAIGAAGILRLSEHVVARSIHEGLLQLLLQDAQDP